jgi:NAD(P)-dependent dehydrogenase (short-subunit alcohol dehydrogenase family)
MNIVITGSSRGIGLELCRQALKSGHQILAVARQPSSELVELSHAGGLHILKMDVTDQDLGGRLTEALKPWAQVDLLINNAGVYQKGETTKDFMTSFEVNSVAPFMMTQALLPWLKKSSNPKVVQVTSLMGSIADNASGGSYAYRASKSALNMINKSLALDNDWLTTIAIHPGWVQTDMGGSQAPIPVVDSVRGIWKVIQDLTLDQSGGYFDYKGQRLPW